MNKRISLALPLLFLAGCAVKVTEPVAVVIQQPLEVTVRDDSSGTGAAALKGGLAASVSEMAEQLDASLTQRGIKTLPISISPFVDIHQPQLHRGFGEELAEGFYHELQMRGYNLIDHRALPFADAEPAAVPMKLVEFYRQHRVSYVLSGTFTVDSSGGSVNARMFDTVTKQVVATGRSQFKAALLEGSLPGYDPFSSRDGLIIENGRAPTYSSPRTQCEQEYPDCRSHGAAGAERVRHAPVPVPESEDESYGKEDH